MRRNDPPRRRQGAHIRKFAVALLCGFSLPTALAQEPPSQPSPQPSVQPSPQQSAQPNLPPPSPDFLSSALAEERLNALRALILDPLTQEQRKKSEQTLCAPLVTAVDDGNEHVRAALDIVETSLAPEFLFGRGDPGNEPESPDFSISVTFDQDFVSTRLSLPRFPSEAGGLRMRYPHNQLRVVWMEGKGMSDMVVVVPPLGACPIKAAVLCPRTYVKQGTLSPSNYTPTGVRYSYSAKIDGLLATGNDVTGTLRGVIRGTKGIPLPTTWYRESVGKRTPTIALKHNSSTERSQPPFIPSQVPILGGIEASLEFGQEGELLRRSYTREEIEVREFPINQPLATTTDDVVLNVEPGMCYLVTQRQSSAKGVPFSSAK